MLLVASDVADAIRASYRPGPAPVVKSAPQRYTLGLAYPAGSLDGHGEFMSAATLEKTAWAYLDGGSQVGLYHSDRPEVLGHGRVVESYIYRGPDWSVSDASGGTQVVCAGDWLLGAVWDEQAWPLVQRFGWSIDGVGYRRPAVREEVERSDRHRQ
jgi:hypothetical protein